MPFTYVPILRTKAGEIEALRQQSPQSISRVTPVFNMPAQVPISFINGMRQLWAGKYAGLDGLFNFQTSGSGAAYVQLFAQLRAGGADIVPIIDIASNPNYNAVALNLYQQIGNRAFIKVALHHIHALQSWVNNHGVVSINCDLIVDAGYLADVDINLYVPHVIALLQQINAAGWRTITLSGASAPKDYGGLSLGLNYAPRKEWILWNGVYQSVPYPLHYSDYTTVHPDMTEPPGAAMVRASVSVRYAIDQNWIIVKGVATSGQNGQPMSAQYLSHAQTLTHQTGFNQLPFCNADNQIVAITLGTRSAGSRTTWVGFGIDRHVALVTDRLP